jgi:hypothetical protein
MGFFAGPEYRKRPTSGKRRMREFAGNFAMKAPFGGLAVLGLMLSAPGS